MFFDLSKAFDRVLHYGLLKPSGQWASRAASIMWFTSYLTNRKQKVVLDGHSLSTANVTSGVPQESILGPLLFSLYIDPPTRIPLSPGSQLLLYADDILLYSPIRNEFDVLEILMPSPTGSTLPVLLSISQKPNCYSSLGRDSPRHHTLYELRSNHTSGLLVLPWSHYHKIPKME